MNKMQKFVEDIYDSSQWYYERSDQKKQFDNIVISEIGKGKKIETAVERARLQTPDMSEFFAEKSISELTEYYEQVHRMDLEIAIADNMRTLAALRKKKAYRDRNAPHRASLPHHRPYGSVAGGSADKAGSNSGGDFPE